MADWNSPALTDLYQDFLTSLKARDDDLATMFDTGTPTNIPTNAVRWNSANARFELWNGTAWVALSALYQIKAVNAGNADTVGGYSAASLLNSNLIPAGTKMVFYQAAAPAGWTKDTVQNDKALRVVSGAGGGSGGTHPLSTPPSTAHTHTGPSHTHSGPSHTHSYSTVIAHTHAFTTGSAGNHSHGYSAQYVDGSNRTRAKTNTAAGQSDVLNTNSAGAHTHTGTTNSTGSASGTTGAAGTGQTGASGTGNTSSNGPTAFAPQFIDVIICTRN